MVDTQQEVFEMLTGVSEGNCLGKRRTHLINQPIQNEEHPSNAEIQQLAQTVASLERQQNKKLCPTSKMAKALTAASFQWKIEKIDLLGRSFQCKPQNVPTSY